MPIRKKPQTMFIDLRKQLLLQVDGEEEKRHTIQWDILKQIGDSAQNLINTLAKYSLEENTLPPDSLKLEFVGLHPGSAVPDWKLREEPNILFAVDKFYNSVSSDFSFVVSCVDEGNFQKIADRYVMPSAKNNVVDAVYLFTNSAGTKPLNVVKQVNGAKGVTYKKLAKVRPMKPEIKGLLRVPEPLDLTQYTQQEVDAYGKFKLKTSKSGRKSRSNVYLYTEKEATLSLRYDSIETDKRIYVFNTEVLFTFTEDAKTHHVNIENQLLDIYAFGANMNEAKKDLFDQFDYTFRRLNQFSNKKLSPHLLDAKTYINLIVDQIKEK